jgi:hypothetical protein
MALEGTTAMEDEGNILSALKDPNASHEQFMKSFRLKVAQIIERDPFLRGLPTDITLQELEDVIAVDEGRAITIFLRRLDGIVIREYDSTEFPLIAMLESVLCIIL